MACTHTASSGNAALGSKRWHQSRKKDSSKRAKWMAAGMAAYVDGLLVRFQVAALHASDGRVVVHGEVTRVVVDRERFLARVSPAGG